MKEAKLVIDALENDHHEHELLTFVVDTSEAFHRTGGERNKEISTLAKISGFNDYPMGLIDSSNKTQEKSIEEEEEAITPMDFTWNLSYDSEDGFAFVDREPLQSSYPTPIHTFNNVFVDDEEFLGFNFQQENHLQEEENCNLGVGDEAEINRHWSCRVYRELVYPPKVHNQKSENAIVT
ncbi:unnamed protein product [Lactuca virosa]|uniref:Uncharacterized protein n=1 Tax=Lactuca virosa TaxID=75947 RepID=A0AAU9MUN3_9ASTR|nr:unnamed protein product [Lactuca virosa]